MTAHLIAAFPGLGQTRFRLTSPQDTTYNCVAFACGDTNRWWWPDPQGQYYWPDGVPREERVGAFTRMLEERGYEQCDEPAPEDGVEKVALFVDDSGDPTHLAYLPEGGTWTSKLGVAEDIEHHLPALEGDAYGSVEQIYYRETDGQ